MKIHRLPWLCALLAGAAATTHAQNRALLLPGQTLPGGATIAAVGDFAMNSQGSWLALAISTTTTTFLVRDGQPIPASGGSVWFSTNSVYLDVDEQGNIGYVTREGSFSDWRLMRNDTIVLQRGDILDIDGDGTVEPVLSLRVAHLARDGSGFVYAMVKGESGSTFSLVRVRRDAQGALESKSILTLGQTLPSGKPAGVVGLDRLRYRTQLDTNGQGDLVVSLPLDGVFSYSPQTDTWKTVVAHGAPSPFFGSTWNIDWYNAVGLGSDGAAYFPQGDWIARDQQIALWPDTGLEFPEEYSPILIQQNAAVRRASTGQVLWAGRFAKPGGTLQSGIARDANLVILDGVTRVEGHTILQSLVGQAPGHNITADGRRILFRGRTATLEGLFEVDLQPKVESIAGCVPKVAELTVTGVGFALTSNPTGVNAKLDKPQSDSAVGLMLLSIAGTTSCGTVLPGVGEVLVPVQLDQLLVRNPFASFLGQAIFWVPQVPPMLELQGAQIFAQGLWFDPFHPVEPVRMSNGLRFVVGI